MPTVSRSYWVRHDENGTIKDVSPALLERIGFSSGHVVNKSLETLVVSGSAQEFRVAWGERFFNDLTGDLIWELNTAPGCSPFFVTAHRDGPDAADVEKLLFYPIDAERARTVMAQLPHIMHLAQRYLNHDVISPLRVSASVLEQISPTCDDKTRGVLAAVSDRLRRVGEDVEKFSRIGLLAVPRMTVPAERLQRAAERVLALHFEPGCAKVAIEADGNIQTEVFECILDNLFTVLQARQTYECVEVTFDGQRLGVEVTPFDGQSAPQDGLEAARSGSLRDRFLLDWKQVLLTRHGIDLSVTANHRRQERAV